jgi:DNA-binding CsgD family transcriptional regulator
MYINGLGRIVRLTPAMRLVHRLIYIYSSACRKTALACKPHPLVFLRDRRQSEATMTRVPATSNDNLDCASLAEVVTSALRAPDRSKEVLARCASVATALGFDGFSYLVLRQGTVTPELLQHWTTAGAKWTAQYAARSYHLIDPRVTMTRGRSVPIVWDDVSEGIDPRAQAFLSDACRHSIRGGVAISLLDTQGDRAVMAWDSRVSALLKPREGGIRGRLGTLALLAGFIHETMSLSPSSIAQRPSKELTPRERECLVLAAKGMTSADISLKLRITERTVNFHIGNIIAKMGALNRGEAIARGVALNIVSMAH